MAKLTCFEIAGMQLWFYSNDHEPPHFHAKRREWEFKVNFLLPPNEMFELVRSKKKAQMSKGDRQFLEQMVEQHRLEILREWEEKVNPHEN